MRHKRRFSDFFGEPIDDGHHGPYKQQWVCLDCRKAFKERDRRSYQTNKICPQCARPMRCVGQWFHPPKMNDDRAWRILRNGFKHIDAHKQHNRTWFVGKRLLEKWGY